MAEDAGYFEVTGRYVPTMLNLFQQQMRVVDHVPDARMRQTSGTGHAVPLTHPEALPDALTEFFSPAQQPA